MIDASNVMKLKMRYFSNIQSRNVTPSLDSPPVVTP